MVGQPSPIRLVFWVELGPRFWYVMGSGGPRPEGRRLILRTTSHPNIYTRVAAKVSN